MKLPSICAALFLLSPGVIFARNPVLDAICKNDVATVKRLVPATYRADKLMDAEMPGAKIEVDVLEFSMWCGGPRTEISNYLLDKGARPRPALQGRLSALQAGLRQLGYGDAGYRDLIFRMIKLGADVNEVSSAGRTPLHGAAYWGDEGLIQLLLDRKANTTVRTAKGSCYRDLECTAADFARLGHFGELADKIEGKGNSFANSIYHAARQGDVRRVRQLLASGASAKTIEPLTNRTALHYAAKTGRVDVIKVLLGAGADPNVVDVQDFTALTWAIVNENVEIAKLLIDAGATAEHVQAIGCAGGNTEFTLAVNQYLRSGAELPRYMIEKGAVNVRDPVHVFTYGIYGRNDTDPQLLQMLLDRGLVPNDGDIDALQQTQTATPWLKTRGTTDKLIAMLQKSMAGNRAAARSLRTPPRTNLAAQRLTRPPETQGVRSRGNVVPLTDFERNFVQADGRPMAYSLPGD